MSPPVLAHRSRGHPACRGRDAQPGCLRNAEEEAASLPAHLQPDASITSGGQRPQLLHPLPT